MSCNGYNSYQTLAAHLNKFVGETVTIFTKSGGISGCGFTGVILAVNCDYVRLVTRRGSAPASPIGRRDSSCCRDLKHNHSHRPVYTVGSVCDIPFDKIAAFCHNAV